MRCLETARLILRPWADTDAARLYEYARDPRVGPPAGWAPHSSVEYSLDIIRSVLSAEGTAAVVLKGGDGLPVGSVGLFPTDVQGHEGEPETGYWIAVPYWGRGLIPEAVRELQRCAFEERGADRVWCGHDEGNEKSRRVVLKCGFTFALERLRDVPALGETRRELMYSLKKEDWRPWTAS